MMKFGYFQRLMLNFARSGRNLCPPLFVEDLPGFSKIFLFLVACEVLTYPNLTLSAKLSTAIAKPEKTVIQNDNLTNLFEGYSQVTSNGKQIGYTIYRYAVDNKAKKFYSTYFLKLGKPMDLSESLVAEADYELNPISYQYTSLSQGEMKLIDANFKNGKMTANISKGKKTSTLRKDIPKGVFLSTFLYYLILKSKNGLQPNLNFTFEAIAEEDAEISTGSARVGKLEKWNGIDVYKVQQRFKGLEYFTYINPQGEALASFTPATGIATEVVSDSVSAIQNFGGESAIRTLFNGLPEGRENAVALKQQSERRNGNSAFESNKPSSDTLGTKEEASGIVLGSPSADAPTKNIEVKKSIKSTDHEK